MILQKRDLSQLALEKIPDTLNPVQILLRKWKAAHHCDDVLPAFEDIMLGSLGKLSETILLVAGETFADFEIIRSGSRINEWIGRDVYGEKVEHLPSDCGTIIAEGFLIALATRVPYVTTAHRVRKGFVETYDLLTLPLGNRWGNPFIAACIRPHRGTYNLVDSIFDSADDGILALAAMRGANGDISDFQILEMNEGAAILLGVPAAALRCRRLSELSDILDAAEFHTAVHDVIATGERRQFELTPRMNNGVDIKVSAAAIGDLVSVTMTDISGIKRREQSFRLLVMYPN